MIPSEMSREALEAFVIRNCVQCKKNCHPFKVGEYYPVDMGITCIDETVMVWVDEEFCKSVDFTADEVNEYFVTTG